MAFPKVKISDDSGNTVDITSNALDVNIAGGASIDIGDVDMFLDGGTALLGGAGAVASGVLRVTLASDDPAVAKLGTIDTDTGNMVSLLTTIDADTGTANTHLSAIKLAVQKIDNAVYDDDSAFTLGNSDVMAMGAFAGAQTITSDQVGALSCTTSGELKIAGSHVDSAAFTLGTHSGVMMMGFAGNQGVSNNDAAALACSASGSLMVQLDPTGSTIVTEIEEEVAINDGNNSITVDNAGTFATQIDGAALTSLQLLDDAIYTDDDNFTINSSKGIVVMGYNNNSQNITSGDVGAITVDDHGQVRTVQNLGEPDTFAMGDIDNSVVAFTDVTAFDTFTDCIEIMLQADEDNTGYIMVGDGDVGDNRGIKMNAGDTLILTAVDTRLFSLWGSADNQNLRCMIMRQDI